MKFTTCNLCASTFDQPVEPCSFIFVRVGSSACNHLHPPSTKMLRSATLVLTPILSDCCCCADDVKLAACMRRLALGVEPPDP
jgi:hypothetical protein